ncbi:MAG: hypothetical protein CVU41_06130 [Chloroflexi bacterium HGW-Chloroflexi-3]|nr:MAG: hypothetical protein CVU41_06130 [Chloroflexi bacterium HGW-Chloroflexi-3]
MYGISSGYKTRPPPKIPIIRCFAHHLRAHQDYLRPSAIEKPLNFDLRDYMIDYDVIQLPFPPVRCT